MNSRGKRQTPTGIIQTKAIARIQVTVEVTAGTWGGDCGIDQLYRQAASDALAKVSRLIGHEGRVYDPKVIGILTEEVRP
jgi:hypothetical protein